MQIPHPSPLFVNRFRENEDRLRAALKEVATAVNDATCIVR
jgi:uracil-DNA glycosylase